MNVPVSLRTRRPWFLIHLALGERLAMPAMLGEKENERTSELVYRPTVVINSFSLGREVSYAWGNRE